MGHIVWYNKGAKERKNTKKTKGRKIKMNAEIRFDSNNVKFSREENAEKMNDMQEMKDMGLVSEKCNCSVYSMVTVAGGVLMAIGTVIYSLIAM